MNGLDSPWVLLLIGFAASLFWRVLGAVLAGRVEVDTPLFDWCVCVTQAMVGGLMVRAILLPSTGLAAVPLEERVAATVLGLAVFLAFRLRVMPAVAAGTGTLVALILWRTL
ncbi:MAG: AzlD domain-containing protein [Alphaproteobacteria bacterium]|nr:MAG: AzlD domain-containing protein [Alphaproteobacteria bacterium]